jgi:hypothetical protein
MRLLGAIKSMSESSKGTNTFGRSSLWKYRLRNLRKFSWPLGHVFPELRCPRVLCQEFSDSGRNSEGTKLSAPIRYGPFKRPKQGRIAFVDGIGECRICSYWKILRIGWGNILGLCQDHILCLKWFVEQALCELRDLCAIVVSSGEAGARGDAPERIVIAALAEPLLQPSEQ